MAVTQPSHKPVIVMNRKNVNLWEKMGRYGTYFSCRREDKDRAIIRKYGEFEGYEIAEAHDGMEAVEICLEKKILI